MASTRTVDVYIWLQGTPVFSLSYSKTLLPTSSAGNDSTSLGNFTDVSGYRPDTRDVLEPNKKYKVTGIFNRETNYNGEDIWILRQIITNGVLKFVYIR